MALFKKKSTRELVQGGGVPDANPQAVAETSKKEKKPRSTRSIGGSRFALGIVCILLAAIIAFVVLPRLYGASNEMAEIIALSQTVEAGTTITEEMLTEAKTAAYRLPQGFIREKNEAVGKVAAERLYAGEYLWSARLTDVAEYEKLVDEKTRGLTDGYCLVTVELPSSSAGVAGVLRAGDSVDIFEFRQNEETEACTVSLSMPEMYVYDVLNEDLVSLTKLDELLDESEGAASLSTGDLTPAYVVFRCPESQGQELIRLEKEKALHMVLK